MLEADRMKLPSEPLGAPLLTGVGLYEAGEAPRLFNSAIFVDGGRWITGRYDKRHRVPFGEFVPFRALLPVGKVVPGSLDFTPGESAAPIGEPPLGVLICYDGVFPELARASAREGAGLLVNLTNDGWYGVSSAPWQHRDFYVLRAIETGKPVLRAANNGLSALIDARGRIVVQTALDASVALVVEARPRAGTTVYVLLGDWLLAACLGAMFSCFMRLLLLARSHHGQTRAPL
jgi:apolipoprotein N-acyltransferase